MDKENIPAAEAALAREVEEKFYAIQEGRRPLERQWELNLNFVKGNQYCRITDAGDIAALEKEYEWEQRRVFNHIAPIVDTRLSKLSLIRPALCVRAASDEEADINAAALSSGILTALQQEADFDGIISRATMWSEICGTAFYKVFWNAGGGRTVGLTEGGGKIKEGNVKICALSPFEIFPYDLNGETFGDQRGIIQAEILPVEDIKSIYGVEIPGRPLEEFSAAQRLQTAGGKDANFNTGSNFELVLERYLSPSAAMPEGRLTVVAGGRVLLDGSLPYINGADGERGYPFIKQTSVPVAGSFFGTSVVDRLIPLQRAYNAVKNRKHEYLNRISMGTIAVEEGSLDADALQDEGLVPGKVIVYRRGGTPPEMLTLGNVPEEFWKEEESLLTEFAKISGTGDLSENADSFSGVTSATGLQLIIEQDDARLNVAYGSLKQALRAIGRHALRLYRQFATNTRLLKYAGNNGASVKFFKGSDISEEDVILEADTDLNLSPAQRRTIIFELIDKGLLTDGNGQIPAATKRKILGILGYASLAEDLPENIKEDE